MSKREKNLWQGIDPGAQDALKARDYRTASFAQELSRRGVDASELVIAGYKQGKNVGGYRKLAYIAGSQFTLGGPTGDSTGLSSPVTLIGEPRILNSLSYATWRAERPASNSPISVFR